MPTITNRALRGSTIVAFAAIVVVALFGLLVAWRWAGRRERGAPARSTPTIARD